MGGCKNKRLIGPYLDGQLGDCRWLDEHIGECSECLAEYELIQRLNHLAQKADFAPPESLYWRNFSTRAMARIVTRQTQTTSLKARLFFGGFRLSAKIVVISSIFVILSVVGLATFYLSGKYSDQNATVPAIQNNPVLRANLNTVESKPGEIAQTNQMAIESTSSGKPERMETAVMQAENLAKPNMLDSEINNVSAGLKGNFRFAGAGKANLIESDLPAGLGTNSGDLVNPSFDQVISYQINIGSRAGEIPLAIYRQAAAKFFGPEKSMPWRGIGQATTPTWGYASGDPKRNLQSDQHLNMELDLSKDK